MRKGFIFDHELCVNCNACKAACILENGWTIQPRNIYAYNSDGLPELPVINLSSACNHCENALCMDGCPTAAYYKEPASGALIIDEERCVGCKYCQWNCPYDAPKYDKEKGVIGKCNLCFSGFAEGRMPACSSACPTGALLFGTISDKIIQNIYPWMPDRKLNPAVSFTGKLDPVPLQTIPESNFKSSASFFNGYEQDISNEWSLVAFSYLSTISVSIIVTSLINGVYPDRIITVCIIVLAALLSLFHLGKPVRAWRTISNLKSSPLSREILLFIIYSSMAILSVLLQVPGFLFAASITGLILLIEIDSVYIYSDRRLALLLHSGQTFISGLLLISFLTGFVTPFIFIATIKLLSSSYRIYAQKMPAFHFGLRFMRIAILLITGISIISKISYHDPVILLIFLLGELLDRITFYIDFDPSNINTGIIKHINTARDEKKRGQ